MAKETALRPLFIGTDFAYVFHIKDDAEVVSIDITGWALSFRIKTKLSDADASALLTKTTTSGIAIAGAFNATPGSNLQRATVTIADTDTDPLSVGVKYWELKRTNDTLETIEAFGTVDLKRGVHRT